MVCSVPNEAALRQAAAACSLNGIRQYLFTESDLDNQATSFATEPISGATRKAFKKFKLWKPHYEKAESQESMGRWCKRTPGESREVHGSCRGLPTTTDG